MTYADMNEVIEKIYDKVDKKRWYKNEIKRLRNEYYEMVKLYDESIEELENTIEGLSEENKERIKFYEETIDKYENTIECLINKNKVLENENKECIETLEKENKRLKERFECLWDVYVYTVSNM